MKLKVQGTYTQSFLVYYCNQSYQLGVTNTLSLPQKSPNSDEGVSLHVMKSAWLLQHAAQTNNVQVSAAFEIREGKLNAIIVEDSHGKVSL